MSDLWLVRHGETEWSATGRHTGRTDIALTPKGEQHAERLRQRLGERKFAAVLTSPLRRARDTCRIAGYGEQAVIDDDMVEWDYGDYEGRTTADIRTEKPDWTIWGGGVPNGETVDDVGTRADRVIARALESSGDVALFAHGHFLRILAARWLGFAAASGRYLGLHTASVCILGYEREQRVIELWNDVSHLVDNE
jgi:probable phosphoglycerate mutase